MIDRKQSDDIVNWLSQHQKTITVNPWGISGVQTYEEFLNGFAGMPDGMNMTFGFLMYF